MKNGWTGGQYSVVRALLGLYLAIHFAMLLPYGAELFSSEGVLPDAALSPLSRAFPNLLSFADAPLVVTALLSAALLASIALGLGAYDRAAALFIAYVWACLLGRNPLISNPSIPYVGVMLLAHACLPPSPYGAWSARGRLDPSNGWTMPRQIFGALWLLLAAGYSYSGYTKLVSPSWIDGTAVWRVIANPLARPGPIQDALRALPSSLFTIPTYAALALELLFLPIALVARARPWLWLALLGLHLSLIALIDFADLSLGMVLIHLFTFDPDWLAPRAATQSERVFYDGSCGLCHRGVRLVLAEDRRAAFRFAPLFGDAFEAEVPASARDTLPDSIVVRTETGALLVRSDAALHILARLGGLWRALSIVGGVLPRPLRDAAYDAIARIRKRVFAKPSDACPIMPRELRARFDM